MADDDQQQRFRFRFPYWTSPPQPSRRDTRAAPAPSPPVAPSPSRRQPQPQATAMAAARGAGGASAPQAQPPQPTRLSSKPSPSRAPPLSPIREPNVSAAPGPASGSKEPKPPVKQAILPRPAAREEDTKELDIIVPQEKIIHEPPSDSKAHNKAVEKEKEKKDKGKEKEKEKKEKEKEKEKEKKEHKEKEKEKDHKEKEKEKEKDHKEKKEKDKEYKKEAEIKSKEHDESKVHEGKLHKELKAGVADMVHKLGASAAPSTGHDRHTPGAAGTTVITLAGENKGASMKVSHADHAESKDAAAKERRAARKIDEGKQEAHGTKGLSAFINSNVQVINNSLMLQSSCSGSAPGVHLKLSTKSKKKGDGENVGGKGGSTAAVKK